MYAIPFCKYACTPVVYNADLERLGIPLKGYYL